MVESKDYSEFAKSELASALATIELNEGNRKGARKLFKQSLDLPTENSVAQAEWASAQVGDLNLGSKQSDVPRNYEAKLLHEYRLGNWNNAAVNADRWLSDQPFSSRPAGVLSYLYSAILERYEDALSVLRFSLISNPGDRILINNLAFALINVGEVEEADVVLNQINPSAISDSSTITLIATRGLLLFRKGLKEIGRNLYLEAIDLAKRKSNHHYAALAALFLAIEEIRADTETKLQSFKNAAVLASRTDEPDVRHILNRLSLMARVARMVPE
jgi:tetratricopeptide (TPR) repeat protein